MDPPFQLFQSSPTTGAALSTELDNETGHHVILWSKIQHAFKGAYCVANDSFVVPFMVDRDLKELIPKRIRYHPGVILKVIHQHEIGNIDEAEQQPGPEYLEKTGPVQYTVHENKETAHDQVADIPLELQTMADLIFSSTDGNSTSAVLFLASDTTLEGSHLSSLTKIPPSSGSVLRPALTTTEQLGFHPYSRGKITPGKSADSRPSTETLKDRSPATQLTRLYGSYVDAELSGQAQEAEQLKGVISQQFKLSPSELQLTDIVLWQMLQTQNQMLQTQNHIVAQQGYLQNTIQSLRTQIYELHEYSIPRLFIVLPKPKRLRDKLKPSIPFKLYFLCECGEHTMTAGTRVPHEIHLAKHEGYDVDQPNRFFEKYGSYILMVMKALRFGVTVAGIVIPPLLHLAESISSIEKAIGLTAKEVGPLMDETIRYIKDHERNSSGKIDATGPGIELGMLEALEGADLRELESFLSIKDKGRVLGNLYRIVTLEGHVKWVCMDHYNETHRQISIQQFRDIVESYGGGVFPPPENGVSIGPTTSAAAKQFYNALVKVRDISYLLFFFHWDATMSDLRTLASAVTTANISKLILRGGDLNGPVRDIVNNSRRYDPIVQLICNGRLIRVELWNFKNFFQHVSSSPMKITSQLESMSLQEVGPFLSDNSSRSLFTTLLRNCPNLKSLWIDGIDWVQGLEFFKSKSFMFEKAIYVSFGMFVAGAGFRNGRMHTAYMCLDDYANLSADKKALALNGTFTHLSFEGKLARPPSSESELSDLLCNNRALTSLRLDYTGPHTSAIVDRLVDARNKCISRNGAPSLGKIEMLFHQGKSNHSMFPRLEMTLTFHDNSTTPVISSKFRSWNRSSSSHGLNGLLETYSWTIDTATLYYGTADDVVLSLHKGMQEKGSRLTELSLNPHSLTLIGVDCVNEIIKLSENLEFHLILADRVQDAESRAHFDIDMYNWVGKDMEIAKECLQRFAPSLPRIELGYSGYYGPLELATEIYRTRVDVPRLEYLHIYDVATLKIARWIAVMAATPPGKAEARAHSQESTVTWTPLKTLRLPKAQLHSEEWPIVLKALDYLTLEFLDLSESNFEVGDLQTLVDSIPAGASFGIDLSSTLDYQDANVNALMSLLKLNAPDVDVMIDNEDGWY